jgi:mycoredoxin
VPFLGADPGALPIPDVLTVYGAAWCGDCRRVTRHLDASGLIYRYLDLETDHAAQAALDAVGISSIPVVVTPDGRMFVEPSAQELAAAGIGAA